VPPLAPPPPAPPLCVVLERGLLRPLRAECARATAELMARVEARAAPHRAAGLLHRVMLLGAPHLTAPCLEPLFASLGWQRAPWRRQLGAHTAALRRALREGGVPAEEAALFSLRLQPHAAAPPAAGAAGGGGATAAAGGGAAGGAGREAEALDALQPLLLHYARPASLALLLGDEALRLHEETFGWLLLVRRAQWALETLPPPAAHAWRLLRAELLHLVGTLYAHLALGVHAEWSAFEARRPELRHVDAFRAAHRDFARRVAARCLLRPSLAPVLRALRLMLGLALQLRAQLQPEHGTQPAAPSHAAVARTAHRWRVELGQGVSFVLRALQAAAATGDEPQLLELSEQLDFNSYYAGRSAG